jgi:hypothetical protein
MRKKPPRSRASESGEDRLAKRLRNTDFDRPVGPGNPPPEWRWAPGYCPNPSGRPRKKDSKMKPPLGPSPFERELIDFANRIVGELDGKPVTGLQSILAGMRAYFKDKPQLGVALLDKILEASRADKDFELFVLQEAIAHKEKWTDAFAIAERCGRPPPDVYPHPDDIIIGVDGKVRFIGPVTRAEARAVQKLIELRENAFKVAREVLADERFSIGERREMWLNIRSVYYRYSRFIPKRLKRPFPPFKPSTTAEE